MLTHAKVKDAGRYCVAAALVLATIITLAVTTQTLARTGEAPFGVVYTNPPREQSGHTTIARAVERFVNGMVAHDAASVWMFASEEDQDAFATEPALYQAYAETFPQLLKVKDVTFTRFWQEGDTPFVQILLNNASGGAEMATMGLWLDDAGDWKLISCDVKPVSSVVAGL